MLREAAEQAPLHPSAQRKRPVPGNEHMKARRRDVYVMLAVVTTTAVLTSIVLWTMGIIGSNEWVNENGSQVHFLSGSPEILDEFVKTHQVGKIVVAFFSTSCPYCRRMSKPFLECSRDFPDVTFVGINAAENHALAKRFNLEVVPSILWFSSGDQLDKRVMYPGQPNFAELKQFFAKQSATVETV